MDIHILRYDTIASTNEEALRQAQMGAREGLCVVANEQYMGRGREGRTWHSGKGGLYFSLLLRPTVEQRYLPIVTLLAAVAVYDTVEAFCGVKPDIKWPNDVLVNEKKISGILAEVCETTAGTAVVVGIGINITSDSIPDEIRSIATSISDESEETPDFDDVLRVLSHYLTDKYNRFKTFADIGPVLGEWSARSSYFKGKEVLVRTRTGEWTGVTEGLDPHGSLLVRMTDGRLSAVTAGDVTAIRPVDKDESESEDEDVKEDDLCENE